MKNTPKFFGIIVLVMTIGFGFNACEHPTNAEKDVTAPDEIAIDLSYDLSDMDEWELTEQTAQAAAGVNKVFTVTGIYASYRWYLDGVPAGTSSSYTFNKPVGVYQLFVIVTNSVGESRSGRCRITVDAVPPGPPLLIKGSL